MLREILPRWRSHLCHEKHSPLPWLLAANSSPNVTGATNSNPKLWPLSTHGKQASPSSGAGILVARQIDRHPQSSPYHAGIVQALQQHCPAGTNSELGTTTRKATVPAITARRRQASPHSPPTPPSLRGGVADAAIQFHCSTVLLTPFDSKPADGKSAGCLVLPLKPIAHRVSHLSGTPPRRQILPARRRQFQSPHLA